MFLLLLALLPLAAMVGITNYVLLIYIGLNLLFSFFVFAGFRRWQIGMALLHGSR